MSVYMVHVCVCACGMGMEGRSDGVDDVLLIIIL